MGIQTFPTPAASVVKSVQAFSIAFSTSESSDTATINAVDPAKTVLHHNGVSGGDSADIRESKVTLTLTDATTITATRNAGATSASLTIKGYAVEYY